ncbi:MAG: hypothetical protein MUC95_08065, partial [Spirochaetes bacterium]|nr:hypothetical protein [Spirochaetota bacterium]
MPITTATTQTKRKLLFEYISMDSPSLLSSKDALSEEKISRLKELDVKTIFIISSQAIYKVPYLRLIKAYENSGFKVMSFHIEDLDNEHLKIIHNSVNEIGASIRKGSCEVVSFGKSCAGTLISCYFVCIGSSAPEAIESVRQINKDLLTDDVEISFVYKYQNYLRPSGDAVPVKPDIEPGGKIRDAIKISDRDGGKAKPPIIEKAEVKADIIKEPPARPVETTKKEPAAAEPAVRPAEKEKRKTGDEKPPKEEKGKKERKDDKPSLIEKA